MILKKWISSAVLVLPALMISGCGGFNEGNRVSFEFKDESVTRLDFYRGGNLVSQKNWLDHFLIPSAFASVTKDISCNASERVKFDMDIFEEPLVIEERCSENLERDLRIQMLESLADKVLVNDYGGGTNRITTRGDNDGKLAIYDFKEYYKDDSIWTKPFITPEDRNGCQDKLTFKKETGEIYISIGLERGDPKYQECLNNEADETNNWCGGTEANTGNCTAEQYEKVLNFRFKDGFFEIDPADTPMDFSDDIYIGTGQETDPRNWKLNDYSRFCIADPDIERDPIPEEEENIKGCDLTLYDPYLELPEIDND